MWIIESFQFYANGLGIVVNKRDKHFFFFCQHKRTNLIHSINNQIDGKNQIEGYQNHDIITSFR